MPRLLAALLAGTAAITVNTLALKAAKPVFHVAAESGGLLRLNVRLLGPLLRRLGVVSWWQQAGLPGPPSLPFWLGFHYLTGFAMVLLYAYLVAPLLIGPGLWKGTLFSLLPWMLNGFVVLPLLGQGLLGIRVLSLEGILYFFVANWLFAALLGLLYDPLLALHV